MLWMVSVEVEVEVKERGGCQRRRCAGFRPVTGCHTCSNLTGKKAVCVWSFITLFRRLL